MHVVGLEESELAEDILTRIVNQKKIRVEERRREVSLNVLRERAVELTSEKGSFARAISGSGISLIAEIKKASPSAGVIKQDLNPVAVAKEYEDAGADALSVLTEEDFFKGSAGILSEVRKAVSKPLLAKDFFIDEYQIYEAKANGADCILLITKILEEDILNGFLQIAEGLGMDCVVEVHNEVELDRAINSGARIIGINNRDLESFEVDLEVTERLCGMIPESKITISESGIATRADVEFLMSAGVDAVLVGETLIRSENISSKIRELLETGKS